MGAAWRSVLTPRRTAEGGDVAASSSAGDPSGRRSDGVDLRRRHTRRSSRDHRPRDRRHPPRRRPSQRAVDAHARRIRISHPHGRRPRVQAEPLSEQHRQDFARMAITRSLSRTTPVASGGPFTVVVTSVAGPPSPETTSFCLPGGLEPNPSERPFNSAHATAGRRPGANTGRRCCRRGGLSRSSTRSAVRPSPV